MSYAISALRRTGNLLFEQPKLVAGLGSVWLLSSLFTVTVGQIPLFGSLLDLLLITPLTFAAMVGMAAVALDDRATFGDLTDNAGAYWKSLAGAFGLVALGGIAVGTILAIGAAVLVFVTGYSGTMTGASGVAAPTTGSTVAMGGLLLVVILVAIAVSVVLQFLDVAIVMGGADATSSFRVAWNVTTTVPVSVVAYTFLRGVIVLVPVVVSGAIIYLVSAALGDSGLLAQLAIGLPVAVVAGAVSITVAITYHVAFFDRVDADYDLAVAAEPSE